MGEPAGQDHPVEPVEVGCFVPNDVGLGSKARQGFSNV